MDRLNLIQDKAKEVIGTYRGPVFLIDLAAAVFLIIYLALLITERTLHTKGMARLGTNKDSRKGKKIVSDARYVSYARKVASFFSIAWLIGVSIYGSTWSRLPQYKIYPAFGFLCVGLIEGLEMFQRRTSWDLRMFLRNILTLVAISVVVVMRIYRSSDDWKLLAVPLMAALPLLSFTLWPRHASIKTKPVPYPESFSLVPGTLLAAWLLATMNYGIPSYIQGVRGKVFRGTLLAVSASVAIFFARLSAAIVAWFLRFRGSVSMAGYTTYAFTGFVFTTLFITLLGMQLSSKRWTLFWVSLFILTAFGSALRFQWPNVVKQTPIMEAFVNSEESLEELLEEKLASGINKTVRLTNNDSTRKLSVDHLRLKMISLERIPLLLRRNIVRFDAPWMLDGKLEPVHIGNPESSAYGWLESGDNVEAEWKTATSEDLFVVDGPYEAARAAIEVKFRPSYAPDTNEKIMYVTVQDNTREIVDSPSDVKVALAYAGEINNYRDLLKNLTYLSRRIHYWKLLIVEYVQALGREKVKNPTFNPYTVLGLTEGLQWNKEKLDGWMMKDPSTIKLSDLDDVFMSTPNNSFLPLNFLVNTQAVQLKITDQSKIVQHAKWIEFFQTLALKHDPRFQMSITSFYDGTKPMEVEPSLFTNAAGRVERPSQWTTSPPSWNGHRMFQLGPHEMVEGVAEDMYHRALEHMLLYMHSDVCVWSTLHEAFWRGFDATQQVPDVEKQEHSNLVEWMVALCQSDPRAQDLLKQVPVYSTLLRKVFQWTEVRDETSDTKSFYVGSDATPLLYDLLLKTQTQNPLSNDEEAHTRVREHLIGFMKTHDDKDVRTMAAILQADPRSITAILSGSSDENEATCAKNHWKKLREWMTHIVDECTWLSMFLYVANHAPRTTPAPEGDVRYPLETIDDPNTRKQVLTALWDTYTYTYTNTATLAAPIDGKSEVQVAGKTEDQDLSIIQRYNHFGQASLLQALHNFTWIIGLGVILGVQFKKEHETLMVGLFGNWEGLGQYRRYAYGAVFVLMMGGLLQMLQIMRIEGLRTFMINRMSTTRQSLPYVIFYGATALYMLPGLVYQISNQQLRTLYFLVLFFVFMFFAPLRPFLPVGKTLKEKWSSIGSKWTNRVNALASGATLFLLVVMVALGFFDRERPWPLSMQILMCILLVVCSLFASPLYVIMSDFKKDPTQQLPSDIAMFVQNVDDLQQDINKGIFYSMGSLIVTAFITWKYIMVRRKKSNLPRRNVPTDISPVQFVDK